MHSPVIFDAYIDRDDYADADSYVDAALEAVSDLIDQLIDPALLSAAEAIDLLSQLASRVDNVRSALAYEAKQ